ncbi:hypothetical protein GUITHDRAFT_146228 [Guillardia theta CCMP2712]|uniref:Uncharacterized protein n=1 Tax=Guillardia theta (strain CCMP2712) TaxID=905079 RepID=L1IHQ7_GUITC|nr:hypothetical protein GUITHDRAFT_146228 [Guillardia theta CCMP2712]EKX35763.1 hypothetical protein GUITHDRAFT_146228 [Guillardia theta CCMP2712]|eukprot:XP_005822743.1 hypothetical protein GUITHDRAFT_146228 [Guillardia theta CCMP2712]
MRDGKDWRSIERARERQQEVARRVLSKRATSPSKIPMDQRSAFHDAREVLNDLRNFGILLGIDQWSLTTSLWVTGIVQVTAFSLLISSSWVLPWIIPTSTVGFVMSIAMFLWYMREQNETAIIIYVCLCVCIFFIALADVLSSLHSDLAVDNFVRQIIVVRNHAHLPECSSSYQIIAPAIVMFVELIASLVAIYICVFKTTYIPRKHKSKLTFRRHIKRIYDSVMQGMMSRVKRFQNRFESQEYKEYKQIAARNITWLNGRFDRTLEIVVDIYQKFKTFFSDALREAAIEEVVLPSSKDGSSSKDNEDEGLDE